MSGNQWSSSLLVLSTLALLACGGETGDPDQERQQTASAEQAAGRAEDAAREHGEAVDVTLAPKNQSGVSGRARLHPHADTLHVTVRLTGVEPGSGYPVHVHEGSCEEGGGVAVGLNTASAQDSVATSETSVPTEELGGDAGYFVQAHLPDGTPAACGDVPGHGGGVPGTPGTGG